MSSGIWDTRDIAVAAYVNMRGAEFGVRLIKVDKNGKESRFFFRGDLERIEELIVSYPTSESCRFDSAVCALKALGYSRSREAKVGG
jgi:hypothetical protein